ncbi:MAG TPA: hypothetical protein VGX25_00655 [Actinophytocola sp.]|uniref:hypothetical protein n=1 Tax=Actinophytocola sp. TaxID=1872138 RepID=UPI002DDD6AF1|nr:hypothetical protein [Actinophytocola sp.]HEV2777889.1 hypothetical protein [Actinophytocola sp.]
MITTWRRHRGWSRDRLAEECAKLGMPKLTAESFTNIESGRRKDGIRRRLVTIDELVVIALALNIPPILLIVPYPDEREVELTPNTRLTTDVALRWFAGEDMNDWRTIERIKSTIVGHVPDEDTRSAALLWIDATAAIGYLRAYRSTIKARMAEGENFRHLTGILEDDSLKSQWEIAKERRTQVAEQITELDTQILMMRRHFVQNTDWPIPELPTELTYLSDISVDEYQRLFATSGRHIPTLTGPQGSERVVQVGSFVDLADQKPHERSVLARVAHRQAVNALQLKRERYASAKKAMRGRNRFDEAVKERFAQAEQEWLKAVANYKRAENELQQLEAEDGR